MGGVAFNRDKYLASQLDWFASAGMGSDTEKNSWIFPNTTEVVVGVCNDVHGFSHVRGICVSTEHSHKPCVVR